MTTRVSHRSSIAVFLTLALGIAAMSCASTEMTSTWTDPAAKGASLSKVAVICLAKDPGLRRMAENTAAANLKGADAVPSYQVLGDADLKNRELVKTKLAAQGFQGALIMRIASVNEQAGAAVYSPGYLETDTIVHVVSNLYSLNDQKLIWSGVSQTFDPASAQSFMTDVSKAVAKSIEKDHLVL